MELYKKLLEVKKKVGAISKDSTNPFFKSKYFDINTLIEHVDPLLCENGLVLIQPIRDNQQYSIIVDVDNGEQVESHLELPNISDPQKLGSCITYYRRYTLQSLLGLQAEDDDANAASKANKKEYERIQENKKEYERIQENLKACNSIENLGAEFKKLTPTQQKLMAKLVTQLKLELEKQ